MSIHKYSRSRARINTKNACYTSILQRLQWITSCSHSYSQIKVIFRDLLAILVPISVTSIERHSVKTYNNLLFKVPVGYDFTSARYCTARDCTVIFDARTSKVQKYNYQNCCLCRSLGEVNLASDNSSVSSKYAQNSICVETTI